MTRMQALRSYTVENAYAAFEENLKGTLEVGKLGDVTVLSQDILTVPDERIMKTEVEYTIVGGKVVYQRGREVTGTRGGQVGNLPHLIREAASYLTGKVRRTPIEYSYGLSGILGVPAWLKLESLQPTGSFKIRGAMFGRFRG